MKFRGVSAKVNFALDGLPVFPALPDTVAHYGGFLNIGPTIEYVERAFDAAKYGWYSEQPFIDAAIQSVVDPDMAPPGKHVMSCFVQYAPYELRGGDWETERERFGDKAQAVLESHFPGFGDLVLHREVVTPVDIERVTGLTEGNIFAGEFLAPQMYFFRPATGLEPVLDAHRRLLPVRLRARTPAAASSAPPASWRANGCCATYDPRSDDEGREPRCLTRRACTRTAGSCSEPSWPST